MALVNAKKMLIKAQNNNYAVGAFNFTNLEQLKVILSTSEQLKADVIIQASESAIKYLGLKTLVSIVKTETESLTIDVCLNLDHGKNFDICKQCIDNGFTNVMFDGSNLSLQENIRITKEVCNYAHKFGVTVEAELGSLKGQEDDFASATSLFTKPDEAKKFVNETQVDSLAISIGTSHGAYKFAGESQLDINRLKEIKKQINIPLVLHGASSVSNQLKLKFKNSGGVIGNAIGVSENNLITAIENGICKINCDTDFRIAFTTGVRETLKNAKEFNLRTYLTAGMEEMKSEIISKVAIFRKNLK